MMTNSPRPERADRVRVLPGPLALFSVSLLLLLALFVIHPHPVSGTATQEGEVAADTLEEEEDDEGLPLEPERTFRRTLTSGTWLSLDVRPDGETIVFELLGDLWTLPIEGGRARPLTSGISFDSQPRYDPGGERIVFISDRSGAENVWIVAADGSDTTQVTTGDESRYHSPEWTPDGDYIVVSRNQGLGPAKLWMYHVEGGSGAQLVQEPERLRTSGAAFGDDPRYIWFAQRRGTWSYNAIFPEYQLAIYDRETGERYTRSSRFGSAFRPTLSPDGRWLVYGTRHDQHTGLRIRELETGQERWLAYPVQRDDQESVASRDVYPGMAFTPDSRALVATWDGRIWRIPVQGGEATEIPFEAEAEVGMGPELDFDYPVDDSAEFTVTQIRDAVPSPDGSRLAFTALDRLYVMDHPDGTPRRLTSADRTEAEPVWSPDGRWIAYATWAPAGGDLRRVRADGSGEPERLTRIPAIYQQPAWSPDGERIVAIRGPARAYREASGPFAPGAADDLVWIPADGGEATRIAPVEGREHPHFTRNPDRIYLYDDDEGLLSIRFDGTDQREHVQVKGSTPPGADDPLTASRVVMAPRGDRALAQIRNDLYVVTVPFVGGETPTISVADPESAAFPARRLTQVGGQFPAWGSDGNEVHWSIGHTHFVYDLARARAAEDSAQAAREREEAEEDEDAEPAEEEDDETDAGDRADEDENGDPVYEPADTPVLVKARRDLPRGTVVLRGARAITMDGDEVIEDADIVIRGHRIAAVGPRGRVDLPAEADTIDLAGATVVPGFVDTHAHLRPAWGIHKTQIWQYLANLAYGVTTTRDPQTGTTDVLTYADEVEAGFIRGPRVYSTGPGIFSSEQIEDLDHARRVLRRYSEFYDTKTIKMYLAGNREQRQWIIQAAREQELMPTTEGALDLKLDLTQIIDGYPGHEHSFPITPLYEDVKGLVAESRSVYTPTLLVTYGGPWAENWFYTRENPHGDEKLHRFVPHEAIDRRTRRRGRGPGPGPGGWFLEEEHVFDEQAAELAEIVEAGGRAGVGSHGQLQGLGYHWELWAVASGGLSNHDALRVATLIGADAIGLDGDLGSIEEGKLADLVVLEGDPLENLRNTRRIRYVMKNGRLYEGDTLDEVWPRERELRDLYWWDMDPGDLPGIASPE